MAQLCEVAVILSGISPAIQKDGPARFVQIKDMSARRRALVRGKRPTAARAAAIAAGDVLVAARSGPILATRPDEELIGAFAALDVYLVQPDCEQLNPDYLAAFINYGRGREELLAAATGGSLPRIPKGFLEQLEIPLVPLEVQRTIGALNATRLRYVSLIEQRMRMEHRLLEAMVRKAIKQAR